MNPLFQTVIIAYLFLGMPISMGVFEAVIFKKEKKSVSEIVTNGYLIMFAIFWVMAVVLIYREQSLLALAKIWIICGAIVSFLAVIAGREIIRKFFCDCILVCKSKKGFLIVLAMASIVFSLLFTRPAAEDITVLRVNAVLETDNMLYPLNPYTGYQTGMIDKQQAVSPIEMLYAAGVVLAGIPGNIIVYYVLPIIMLMFFFLAVWRLACVLLESEKYRMEFVCIVTILYWMTAYMENRTLVTGIFLNSFNGLTILSCIILPLMFSMMLELIQQAENGIKKIPMKSEKCVMAVVTMCAAQLTDNKGGFYVMLMLLLGMVVIIVKGGKTYGIKTGRFKKRI